MLGFLRIIKLLKSDHRFGEMCWNTQNAFPASVENFVTTSFNGLQSSSSRVRIFRVVEKNIITKYGELA